MPGTASLNGRTREASVRFLTALAQTIKVVSLYKIGHPVPTSAVQETWNHLHELFTVTGWDEVALGNEGGRSDLLNSGLAKRLPRSATFCAI